MNPVKGEVEITLAGKEFILRPTFEAMVEFEERAKTSTTKALQTILNQELSFILATAVIWAGIRGGWSDKTSNPPSYPAVGEMIRKTGLTNLTMPLLTFLNNALSSEAELQGK